MPLTHHTGINVIACGMYTYMYMYMFMYIYISVFIHASCGQMVTVVMKSTTYAEQGTPALLMCNYSVNDMFYTFNFLQWHKETDLLASYTKGSMQPYYPPEWGDKYSMTTDSIDSSSVLTVSSVQFPSDEGRYICRTQFRKAGTGTISNDTSTLVNVIVLSTSIALSDSTGTYPSTGGKAYLVEGVNHQFNCTVPGINPGASFSWSVGGRDTTEDNSNDIVAADGLTTSSSTVTLSPIWSDHGETLLCKASNKDGHAGISGSLTLDIKVPPKTSSMTLSDTNGALMPGGTASVDQGASHVFTCQAQSRPEATIQWDLGSNSYQQSTIGPTSGGPGDGLVNTTSMWTFTPGRDNHRQQVKCEANTTESQPPYPSVMVTLNVNGPPNTPVITGSQQAVENTPTSLICRADMGYPETWNLTWSYGDLSVTGLTTNSAHNNRFNFSTTLAISSRIFNGKVISCTAERGSWKSGVGQTSGAVSVEFCARNISVSCPPDVTAGNEVTLTCLTSESSNPATTLTWYNNSESVTSPIDQEENPGAYGGNTSESTYRINVLTKYHNQNQFRCCANNSAELSCAEDLCHACTLNVKYAPEFTSLTQSPNTPVTEGSNVTLTCTIDANPMPGDITWEKQGSDRAFNSEYNAGTSTLTLSNITRERSGYYTCKANNEIPTGNPAHMVNDVVSSPLTVIVHYKVNITNKGMTEQGGKDGGSASLTCIAKGNPRPTMQWYGLNNTVITNETDTAKFMVVNVTTGGDGVYGFQVTSTLTINNINSDMDFGTYTCISTNGIGEADMLKVNLTGTRRPDKPTKVMITGQTAESLTVTWTAGYNGGEEQSFRVSYLKTLDSTKTSTGDNVTGGNTTYLVTGLEDYTEYEIRVYAKNIIGENTDYANVVGHTLPKPPNSDAGIEPGITVEYNTDQGTVKVTGLRIENSCIQLEVKYEGNDTWQECGECIASNRTVTLSEWCAASQKRRRRAVGDIEDVRAKLCIGGLCSEAAPAEQVKSPSRLPPTPPSDTGIIVGAVVGGVVLLAIIIALATYLVRMSPKDQRSRRKKTTDSFSNGSDIELQSPSNVAGPEEGNGMANEGVQNHEYDELSRKERYPVYPNPAVRGDSLPPETGAYEEMKVAASKTCSENATNKVQENVEKSSPEETTNKVTNRDSKPPITRPKPKSIKKYQPPSRSADEIPERKAELAGATETTETTDTYAQVNKNLPPKPKGINPPQNLPDVTYASVNKDQKSNLSPLPEDYGAKKKPKKYVPPSARAAEESAYEEVRINDNDKGKNPSAEGDGNTYDGVGAQQDTGGRTANDDGLIYVEVGHARVHPPDQPPIQTEPSTEYASLDFSRMSKKED